MLDLGNLSCGTRRVVPSGQDSSISANNNGDSSVLDRLCGASQIIKDNFAFKSVDETLLSQIKVIDYRVIFSSVIFFYVNKLDLT